MPGARADKPAPASSTTAAELLARSCRLSGCRPLGLCQVALGHALRRRDLGRVAQVPLGIERRLRAGAGGCDRLAVGVVDEVTGGEDPGAIGAGGAPLDLDVAVLVDVDLAAHELRLGLVANR